MTKQIIEVLVADCDQYDFSGNLDEVIAKFQKIRDQYSDGNIRVDIDYSSGWYDSVSLYIRFYQKREETDAEYADRTQKEENFRQAQLAYKRQQLANLKKELGEE